MLDKYQYFFGPEPGIEFNKHVFSTIFEQNSSFVVSSISSFNTSSPVSIWHRIVLHNVQCADEAGSVIFNDSSKFLNYCFIVSMMFLYSMLMIFPTLYRIKDIRDVERGSRTSFGQLNIILSLACPSLWICHAIWANVELVPGELVSIFTGFVTSYLHYLQDGRVVVSSPEILLYWLGFSAGYLLYAVDSVLRLGWNCSWFMVLAFIFAVNIFVLELVNPQRKRDDSYEAKSFFSKASISFANETLKLGQSKELSQDDIPPPPMGIDAFVSCDDLDQLLKKRPDGDKNRLIWALKDLVGFDVLLSIILSTAASLLDLLGPQVMILFLRSLAVSSRDQRFLYKSYYTALLIGILPICSAAMQSFALLHTEYARSKSRAALVTLIYRKTLNLSPKANEIYDTSKITNLVSVDANQIFSMVDNLPSIIALPLAIAFSLWQLWVLLGPSFLAAALVYLLTSPIQAFISRKSGGLFPILMKVKDKRNKLTTNALRCIKTLKLHAWEVPYFKKICEVRDEELQIFRRITYLFVSLLVTMNSSSRLVSAAIFTIYLWMKCGALTPDVAFPAMTLLAIVSEYILVIPMAIVGIQQSFASQIRVNELLVQPMKESQNYERINEAARDHEEASVIVDSAKISWNGESVENKVAIESISFHARRGDLVCIVGRVGCGKTAVLRALCDDLCILGGNITLKGSIAFCSQDVWLQNASLRDNILFGEAYNERWYKRVVSACELDDDIKSLQNGHETSIGERGISLSGGQKARVALARAVYSRADIFILDDVLSAVDEHVGAALITKIFSVEGIIANRTVILATNNVKVLSHSSKIIALEEKKVAEISSYQELVKNRKNSFVFRLIQEFGNTEEIAEDSETINSRKSSVINNERTNPSAYPPLLNEMPQEMQDFKITDDNKEEEEERTQASLAVYLRYYFMNRPWLTWLLLLIMVTAMSLSNFVTVFLGRITSHSFTNLHDARYYITVYFVLIFISIIIMAAVFTLTNIAVGLKKSKILHEQMLWSVLRAPMSFFDRTPVGKLINRFTSDISRIDNRFADIFGGVARCFISLTISLVGILVGSPHVLLLLAPLTWIVNNMRKMYVPTRRKVTRIFIAANSPILSHVEESLKGHLIINAFGKTSWFMKLFYYRVNYQNKASFFQSVIQKWLQFRVAMICAVLSLVSALGITQLISFGLISTSYAGVVLSFAKSGGTLVGYLLNQIVVAETSSISLERIFEYIDLAQEAPDVIEATRPDKTWPSKGEIIFNGLSARYTPDGPEILKNLSLTIHSGEKIGVVGRTGSGKSTLALTIFRLLEASQGTINLDNVDVSILGLTDLRSHLSIVPQDSQIFDSTVRENLDPFGKYDDAKLWEILDKCHLKEHFQMYEGLNTILTESGSTLSRGQCQLLCLGRALVHETKILVLDEATASVDHETDKILQKTIRKEMADRTIISIAHRLNTIMDADRIIVLDQGEIKEFDTPEQLLKTNGLFYKLYHSEQKSKS